MNTKLTIKDIATLSNTSKTTVSFYLNGKTDKMSADTQKRIRAVIEKYNYKPSAVARSLNAKSMKLIGVIIGDITNSFANQIVKGIDEIAKAQNYQLIVGNSNYDFNLEKQYVDRMLAMGVDGFIVQPTIEFEEIEIDIRREGKPVVFIDSQSRNKKGLWVKTNNYEAVMEATEKVMERGYEDYILISANPGILTTRMERTRGFQDTLTLQGKECKRLIVDTTTSSEEIATFLDKQLDLSKKTCVFVANCWALPKVFLALKDKRQYMPKQIGLLGFDNLEWTEFSMPTVTTIVQPAHEEGRQSCKILIDAIEDLHEEAPNQILKCSFNIMESTNL